VLFDDDGGDEPVDGGVVGEHANDIAASLHFPVDPFERVGRPDLAPVLEREGREREGVVAGVDQNGDDVGELAAECGGDAVELLANRSGVGLGEDRADRGGDHLGVHAGDAGQDVAHEVLGPSRDPSVIQEMDPPAGQSYLRFMQQAAPAEPSSEGLAESAQEARVATHRPFRRNFTLTAERYQQHWPHLVLADDIKDAAAAIMRDDDLAAAVSLDKAINNTSLMLRGMT
jgi:hypothetical protein